MKVDVAKVAEIIREAAATEIMPRFRALDPSDIKEKKPGDLVTAADRAAEDVLTRRLKAISPGALIVGEEAHESRPEALDRLADAERAWIIDPLDGTHNFAHGTPRFAVIVAFSTGGQTVAGWIHDPVNDRMALAEAGAGAMIDSAPPPPMSTKPLSSMTVSLARRLSERVRQKPANQRPAEVVRYRTVGIEYLDLVAGRIDAARYAGKLMPWDHAAGVLMHREAGGHAAFSPSGRNYALAQKPGDDALIMAPSPQAWRVVRDLTR